MGHCYVHFAFLFTLISDEFPAINLTPNAQIHTAIQDDKYAANMRTRQSIGQSATGTTISDDVNYWSIGPIVFRVDFISALLGNYYEFFYA